jgi:AcrR family transcriptional regulator
MDPRIARTQAAVRRAATDLLVEGGPAAVTVDAVVARSGVAKSTIYRHWATRDELLVDAVQCMVPDLPLPAPEVRFEAALREVVHRVVEVLTDPEWARVLPAVFMLKLTDEPIAGLEEQMHEHQKAIFRELLRRGDAEGLVPPDLPAEEVAAHLIGPLLFASLTGEVALDHAFGDRVVDHFLTWSEGRRQVHAG